MGKFKTNEEFFTFSKRLVVIPTEDIKKLLIKHKIKLPLYAHAFLLKETIRSKVFEERLFNTYSDELKFRLRGYDDYSIYPLEKLINKYNLDFELARYKELLFDFIYINSSKLSVKNSFINELQQLQHNYTVDLEVMKYSDFYALISDLFYEADGYLDGVAIKDWTEDLLASYTLGDLKELGKKYSVSVPRRINKAKLIQILTSKFKLTVDEASLLSKKSVLDLEIYSKEKGFQISIDLKKKDMIEYIKFSLSMYHKKTAKDDFMYDVPLETKEEAVVSDIEDDIPEVIEEVIEPVIIPVEEEVEEPISEQIIEPEPESEEFEEEPEAFEEEPEAFEEEPEEFEEEPEEFEEEPEEFEEEPEEFEEEPEVIEEEPEIVEEEPKVIKKELKPKPVLKKELKPKPVLKKTQTTEPKDESLLSNEEKELLDEKINQIIKKYYKKRRRRRTTWIIAIVLIVVILGFAGYSYYTYMNQGNLPFGIPVFW
ncbi:hypothetical protein RJI07_00260 [Mycoplasmatota bacterium WC30]